MSLYRRYESGSCHTDFTLFLEKKLKGLKKIVTKSDKPKRINQQTFSGGSKLIVGFGGCR